MQLQGQTVRHKLFGNGVIEGFSNEIITVKFAQGSKRFIYPDAFTRFLMLENAAMQKEIRQKCDRLRQEEEAEKKREYKERESRWKIRAMKIMPESQAAFHVENEDAAKIIRCGELSTGCYLSGKSKGEPRVPIRLKPNSACLLTGLPGSGEERDRIISGALMVKEDFWGKQFRNGIVECHGKYKITLPSGSVLRYWNYFQHGQLYPRWGRVAFQYFSNDIMLEILLDMAKILADTEQEAVANEFYQYFCAMNRLSAGQRA